MLQLSNQFIFLKKAILVIAGILISTQCSSLDPERQKSEYYYEGRFHNLDNDDAITSKTLWTVLSWKLFGPTDPPSVSDMEEAAKPAQVQKRKFVDFLAPKNGVRIIWLGHASVWIAAEKNGQRFHMITDPNFYAVPLRSRLTPLPLELQKFPPVDAVVVSHAHMDHLSIDSLHDLQDLHPQMRIFLPDGMRVWAAENNLKNVHIMNWWQSATPKFAQIKFQPAHHWTRMGLSDTMQYHWGSYTVEVNGKRIYFAGDTGFSSHFEKIAQRNPEGYNVALMPIGAYKPRWFMQAAHIDPAEALQASRILRARLMLPIHWGTLALGDDLPSESALYLKTIVEESTNANQPTTQIWDIGTIVDLP